MKLARLGLMTAVLAVTAQAQDVKVNACLDLWYTQMMSSNLRTNSEVGNYYALRGEFKENGFAIRRAEIYLGGKITDELSWSLMFDPNTTTGAAAWGQKNAATPNVLVDAAITWKPFAGFELKVGQFKAPTGYEATLIGSPALLFWDRGMINRQYNDRRDRGVQVSYAFGDAKGFNAKAVGMISNGTSDWDFGRGNDANAQKDITARFEMGYGAEQKFGFYHRTGATDQADKGALVGRSFGVNGPSLPEVLDNKDKTTTTGAYYYFDNAKFHGSAEVITGLLGRRRPSVGTAAGASNREHLDQKFLSYVLSGAFKITPQHWVTARYDFANYNQGDKWYGATSPYIAGANDYTPKFTEIVVGYNYNFVPSKWTQANFKANYILRSKNFLQPLAGQVGEQGGDSLVLALQVAF